MVYIYTPLGKKFQELDMNLTHVPNDSCLRFYCIMTTSLSTMDDFPDLKSGRVPSSCKLSNSIPKMEISFDLILYLAMLCVGTFILLCKFLQIVHYFMVG